MKERHRCIQPKERNPVQPRARVSKRTRILDPRINALLTRPRALAPKESILSPSK